LVACAEQRMTTWGRGWRGEINAKEGRQQGREDTMFAQGVDGGAKKSKHTEACDLGETVV
jgi:hypothetical protein